MYNGQVAAFLKATLLLQLYDTQRCYLRPRHTENASELQPHLQQKSHANSLQFE